MKKPDQHQTNDQPIPNQPSISALAIAGAKLFWMFLLLLIFSGLACLGQNPDAPLLEAIKQGDVPAVKSLLAKNASIEATDPKGRTPLMLAVLAENAELVQLFLEKGADLGAKDTDGQSARSLALKLQNDQLVAILDKAGIERDPQKSFFKAVRENDLPGVKRALEKGADVNARTDGGRTALILVAGNERATGLMSFLLEHGAQVNAVDASGQSALDSLRGYAEHRNKRLLEAKGASPDARRLNEALREGVEKQEAEVVATLLKKKADPNHVGEYKSRSVLMVAAEKGNPEIVNYLLASGANPNVGTSIGDYEDRLGMTPLFFALMQGHLEVVKALIQNGANVNLQTRGGISPLMLAVVQRNAPGLVKTLLDAGAKVNAKRADGMTALTLAVRAGASDETIKMLLEANADGSVLAVAASAGRIEIVKRLLEKPLAQETKDAALLQAAYSGHADIVRLLLTKGADPNAHDQRPRSAIQFAADQGHTEVVKLLAQAGAKDHPHVSKAGSGEVQTIDPAKVTKAQWRKAVAPFNVNSPQWQQALLSEQGFKARMGTPAKEQRIGHRAYWYYRCRDGELQVVIEADLLEQQGVVIKSINEF